MWRLCLIGVSIFLTAVAASGFGQSFPEGFRDLKWGATREQVVRAFHRVSCEIYASELYEWLCTVRSENVNGVSVMIKISDFTTGPVVGMSGYNLSFTPEAVDRIVDAFEARYGKPSRLQQRDFLTEAGGRVPKTEWLWEFPDSTITVLQQMGPLENGIALVRLRSAVAEWQDRREEERRKHRERGAWPMY